MTSAPEVALEIVEQLRESSASVQSTIDEIPTIWVPLDRLATACLLYTSDAADDLVSV